MVGQPPVTMGTSLPSASDPNEILRRIDQTTTMTFHWVRIGVVVSIVLLLVIALGF